MFFLSDVLGTILATFLFAFLLFTPGYIAGFSIDLFDFRAASFRWRAIMSLPLSIAVTPLTIYLLLLTRVAVLPWLGFAAAQGLALALALGRFGHEKPREWLVDLKRIPRAAWIVFALWLGVSVFSLADLQLGDRLYYSTMALDHEFRVAVIDAITRTGIPPVSPFNHIDGDVTLRYHVFWFALCSFGQRMGGGWLNGRHALNASVIWCGFALMCLVPLSLRVLEGLAGPTLRRRASIGIALLSVTGLDLIPSLIVLLVRRMPLADMEWWSTDQVTSWADALFWVPHHVAAVIAGFTGFLLIWHAATHSLPAGRSAVYAAAAGAALAAAAGISIYVGCALAIALTVWTVFTVILRWRRHTILLASVGLAGILLGMPNAVQLIRANAGGQFLKLGVWSQVPTPSLGALPSTLFYLGLSYVMQFGFFLLAGLEKIRQIIWGNERRPWDIASLVIGGTILLLCSFVRSATIANNDFGWRGFMLLQFVLLLWATDVFDRFRQDWRLLAYPLLLAGCLGTVYQLGVLRFFNVAADFGIFQTEGARGGSGQNTYSLRAIYGNLERKLPPKAIVQANPDTLIDYTWGLYAHRQTVTTGGGCTVAVGGSLPSCQAALPVLRRLFDPATVDPASVMEIVDFYRIDAIVVSDADAIWSVPGSWIQRTPASLTTPHARAYLFSR